MFGKLLFGLLLLWASQAHANEFVVHGYTHHTWSYHESHKLTDNTPGVGVVLNNGLGFGVLSNSFGKPSVYVGGQTMITPYVGLQVAVASGYQQLTKHGLIVLGGAVGKYQLTSTTTLQITVIPNTRGWMYHTSMVFDLGK